ncbi:hypothetical protein COO91_09595 (plasmid) [Nostoc flagelliforme CCNUN1]|uniref:Uncharacterized protein n=1 Tax=Nostoc flagelliforme CCNUN1 TaxID=2038116 RepID=A0A2K8T6T8_9NOSO|nr:hypothetical protein COO91_09595 [Nostoc flagelliforme CCNUN1]
MRSLSTLIYFSPPASPASPASPSHKIALLHTPTLLHLVTARVLRYQM